MTSISHNLTGKIDEKTVAILSEIDAIARELRIAFFIVGATARDILLQHAHGIRTTRATLDVDIGVFVTDWDQFQTLKEALVNMDRFFEEADIIKEEVSDYDRSSARFLGRDIARMAIHSTKSTLTEILGREAASSQGHQLAMDILRQNSVHTESYEQVVA